MKIKPSRCLLFAIIALFAFSAVGCKDYSSQIQKMDEGEYLVSYSREYSPPSRLVLYNKDGTILDDKYQKDGQALGNSVNANGRYIFTSVRINLHYEVSPDGKIESFFFSSNQYKAGDHCGTIFVSASGPWILSAMNIGNFAEGYVTELVRKDTGTKVVKMTQLTAGYVDSAVAWQGKVYAHAMHSSNKAGIYEGNNFAAIIELDENSGAVLKTIPIKNRSLAECTGRPMKLFNDSILIYGDSFSCPDPNIQSPPCLAVFDLKSDSFVRSIPLGDTFAPISLQIYNGKIYVISTEGRVKVFDSDYNLVKEFSLSDNALAQYSDKQPFIVDTILDGPRLYVFYRFRYDQKVITFPGAVHVYDLDSGTFERKTELRLPGEKKWWADEMTVLLVNRSTKE